MAARTLEVAAIEDPGSVAGARRWLRDRIARWGRPELGEVAELVLSELVTNAVLHSPGPLRVSVTHRGAYLAIEVVDANAEGHPVVNPYPLDAPTGRGMHVVDQLALAWGVRALAAGKGVWALLGDPPGPGGDRRGAGGVAIETWLLADPTATLPGSPPPDPGDPGTTVVLRAFPVRVYLAACEHHDALERELRLLELSPGAAAGPPGSAPTDLAGPVVAARRDLAWFERALARQVAAAARAGRTDLEVPVAPAGAAALARLFALLDEVDARCDRGQLVTLASPPIVRHFRAWILGQVRSQVAGAAATPWPGHLDGSSGKEPGDAGPS